MVKCTDCKKKLTLVQETTNLCRCDKYYCDSHKDAVVHKCSFDYHNFNSSNLHNTLVTVVASKIDKI